MRRIVVSASFALALLVATGPVAVARGRHISARETSAIGATGASGATGATGVPAIAQPPHRSLSSGTLGPIVDPLAANGFTSPSCTTAELFVQLDASARRDCAISGVAVASVPLSNYGFDTNITTGLDASVDDDLDSIVQGLVITPVWTALVWLAHVAIVALEWCYSIDLLVPAMMGAVASALGGAERVFTEPWLGLVLALAGIVFAWNGLVRRRVAETLGQASLMLAMMAVGLWVIADPFGTVGSVSRLADQAALSTVSATATGSAAEPAGGLDDALSAVFDSAITAPWCFLEFGDVNWCRDPSQLDPRLAATGRKIEQLYTAGATCHGSPPGLVQCVPPGSEEQHTYASIALALSAARTNGALFLALPAGQLARNDLPSQTPLPTLYGTLCGASDPTGCTAGTAPQAAFRTAEGTWPRAGGLLLIAIGLVGMLLLLGFIALRLLGAALAVLIYLMLAPLAVLAPAFGDGGRSAFRVWFVRLIGAALSKLVYSVMLGVTLLIANLLTSLEELGWWTQWLLLSVFWWLAFEYRHRILSFATHERGEPASRLALATRLRYQGQAYGSARHAGARVTRNAKARVVGAFDALERIRSYGKEGVDRLPPPHGRSLRPASALAAQVEHSLGPERARPEHLAALRDETVRLRARRELLRREQRSARRMGSTRRAVSLAVRAQTVDAELAERRRELKSGGGGHLGRFGAARSRATFLDGAALRVGPRRERDYVRLAGLADLAPSDYRRAPEPERRAARLEIERQLAQRREWLIESGRVRAADSAWHHAASIGRRERQFAGRVR